MFPLFAVVSCSVMIGYWQLSRARRNAFCGLAVFAGCAVVAAIFLNFDTITQHVAHFLTIAITHAALTKGNK